jgi:hypothetical protein
VVADVSRWHGEIEEMTMDIETIALARTGSHSCA